MTIDAYLAELRRRLPSTRRKRLLREAEDHLRDLARERIRTEGVDPAAAEAAAVEAFGRVDDVADRFAREAAPVAVRRAAVVATVGLAGLIVPLYGVPENLLPPAPWIDRPAVLDVLVGVTEAAWLGAAVVALLALTASAAGRARLATTLLLGAGTVGAASLAAAIATTVAWRIEAPATPIWSILALLAPTAAATFGVAVAAVAWARAKRPLLD
jgi:HAAS